MNNNLYETQYKLRKKINLSRKNLIKKISNIKTEYTQIFSNLYKNKNINKKNPNLHKKNLTYVNIYDYNYNYINISERKIKNPLIKLKQDLLNDTDYSSFISKKHKNINSGILITGLNTTKKSVEKEKYINYFSPPKKNNKNIINDYYDYKKAKTSSKILKSNIKDYNTSLIHFNKDKYNFPLNNEENPSDFREKTRIIRREKIRRYTLEDKIYCMREDRKEKFNIIKITKDEYFKNLDLFHKYLKSYDKFLIYLENEISKETRIDFNLQFQKDELKKEINNLQNKKESLEYDKIKYQNIRKFLISAKYGYEAIKKKDIKKEDISIFITEENDDNYSKTEKKLKIVKNKNIIKTVNLDNKKNFLKHYTKNNISINEKGEKLKIKKSNSTELFINDIKIYQREQDKNLLKNIFSNFENSIINSIYSFNDKRKNIYNLKKNLSIAKSFKEGEYYYDNMKISSKVMKLFFLKKENIDMKLKYNSIKKVYALNEDFKNNLEKKIYNLLFNLNKQINIQEILCIKNLFILLKLKKDEFFDKMKINKVIYMIKIIELISSYFINLKNKYCNDSFLKNQYDIILNKVEREKYLRMMKLNKDLLKKKSEQKKIELIKKTNEVRFFSYKKYNHKYNKNNKQRYIKTLINKKDISSANYYEQWLTYT